MALTITIPGAVSTTTGSIAPAVLTVGVGSPGVGVPSGGSTGQYLVKASGTSYDTAWLTLPANYITSVTAPLAVTAGNLAVNLSAYLTTATAASTYQTLAGMSAYLQKSGGYITGDIQSNNNSAYRSYDGSTKTSVLNSNYLQLNTSGGGGGALTIESSGITFPSGKQTVHYPGLSILDGYATESWVTAGFYPLSGNPSNFLTDAPSDGSQYARQDGAWSVVTGGGGSYLPLAGGTMTGAIVFDGTSGQYISKGNFDTSRGGNYGISLVCSIGYEFNWQAGWLTTTNQGSTTPRPLYLDSLAGTTLRAWNSETNFGTEVSYSGITMAETTNTVSLNPFGIIASNTGTDSASISAGEINLTDGQAANYQAPAFVRLSVPEVDPGAPRPKVDLTYSALTFQFENEVPAAIYAATGITFPDSTVQTTAYTGGGGGGFVPGSGNLDMGGYDVTNANFNSSAGQVSAQNVTLSSGGSLTFGDSTVQTSAANPFNGGTIANPITITDGSSAGYYNIKSTNVTDSAYGGYAILSADVDPSIQLGYFGTGAFFTINPNGITFPDSTVQTTAAVVGDAPSDGNYYVRQNGAWVACTVVSIYDSNTSTSYNCLTV